MFQKAIERVRGYFSPPPAAPVLKALPPPPMTESRRLRIAAEAATMARKAIEEERAYTPDWAKRRDAAWKAENAAWDALDEYHDAQAWQCREEDLEH